MGGRREVVVLAIVGGVQMCSLVEMEAIPGLKKTRGTVVVAAAASVGCS